MAANDKLTSEKLCLSINNQFTVNFSVSKVK